METIHSIIQAALAEDIGQGDATSQRIIPKDATAQFALVTREPIIVCGLEIAAQVFHQLDPSLAITLHHQDGDAVQAGARCLSGSGNARAILAAERVALNLMQRLSGIATQTKRYVEAVRGTRAVILDTRKTTPLLRELEKYAVTTGGGQNHRFRLDDAILIKDNHISIAGSLSQAVELSRIGTALSIEVECDTLEQVAEALQANPDRIMLDNMTLAQMRQAVALVQGRIPLEASGNVSLENVRAIAETGVDFISVGRLTHSVKSADIGLDIT